MLEIKVVQGAGYGLQGMTAEPIAQNITATAFTVLEVIHTERSSQNWLWLSVSA